MEGPWRGTGYHDLESVEALETLAYVAGTLDAPRPVRLVGFDPQFSADSSGAWHTADLALLTEGLEHSEGPRVQDWNRSPPPWGTSRLRGGSL